METQVKLSMNQLWKMAGKPGKYADFADQYHKANLPVPSQEFRNADGQTNGPLISDSYEEKEYKLAPGLFDNNSLPTVTCNDGSKDIATGIVAPCLTKGGEATKVNSTAALAKQKAITNCVFYAGIGISVGVIAVLIYKKLKT